MEHKFLFGCLLALVGTFVFLTQFIGLEAETAKEFIGKLFEFSLLYAIHIGKTNHSG